MIGSIKKHYYKTHLNKIPARESSKGRTNQLRSVTILSDDDFSNISDMRDAMGAFERAGIQADGFLVSTKADDSDDTIVIIGPKDIHWYDIPKQETMISWLQHKTDLLIVLNPNSSPVIKYLCASSNSLLKTAVAFSGDYDEYVDFCIEVADDRQKNIGGLCQAIYTELLRINRLEPNKVNT